MMQMQKMVEKKLADGATVTVWRDSGHHGFYVAKVPDDKLAKHPMGAFVSLEAARAWADHAFEGGDWR